MAAKPTPERKSRSGSYVPDVLRGAKGGTEERLVIRCHEDLAMRAREAGKRYGLTLAELLAEGLDAIEDVRAQQRASRGRDEG